MQYENNLRKNVFYREKKKQYLVFKKPFSKRYIWKKRGRLIIRVVLYLGQYGTLLEYFHFMQLKISNLLHLRGNSYFEEIIR